MKVPRRCGHRAPRHWLWRWFLVNSLLSGLFALAWLVFRSGSKPSRLAYPCQQAAAGTAITAFGVPLLAAIIAGWRRVTLWMRTPAIAATACLGLLLTAGAWIYFSQAAGVHRPGAHAAPRLSCPVVSRLGVSAESRLRPVPRMEESRGHDGARRTQSLPIGDGGAGGGPDGIIAANDVVVIKINYQWDQRGGTNTDLLRGLIRSLIDHPDGFTARSWSARTRNSTR